MPALEALVEPFTRGDPESPLRWTSKSLSHLQCALASQGYPVSVSHVRTLLKNPLGYSLQAPRKTKEGGDHPDRDAQFRYIQNTLNAFQARGWPTISVDAKKKEKIGNYTNTGREYYQKGDSPEVKVYDFVDKILGKVVPYGIDDIGRNEGFVNVGIGADTAKFAVNSIRAWWHQKGRTVSRTAPTILITADGGGSNSSRVRLWKVELQKLATEMGRSLYVCHYPPGTSKWNKIEHRMFAHISINWRGKPLVSREVVVRLIEKTTTKTGLTITVQLDERVYEKGIKVTDKELAAVNIERATFHGEWNYVINPTQRIKKV